MTTKKFLRQGPQIRVKNLQHTLAWYRNTLGFYEEWTWSGLYGGIQRDDMRLLFTEDPVFTCAINNDKHRLPILWFVDNINGIYTEFKKERLTLLMNLEHILMD